MARRILRRGGLVLVLLLAGVGAGIGFWWRSLPEVALTQVRRGTVAEVVYATGVVEPVEWAKVVPVVRGRIVELCACEGQGVKRGDVLGRLDDTEARAQAREIEARLAFVERQLERLRELRERGVATAEALDRSTAEVAQARALLAAQRERIDNMVLRAPQDGVVLRRDFQVGEIVSTSDVIAWVGRPSPLRIVAEVAEEDIGGVRPGLRVLLRHDAFRGRVLPGTVEHITPKGDPVQRTFRVHLALPEDTPLRVGMSVEANIVVTERTDALIVPAEAVRGDAVFLLGPDGRLARRAVGVGLRGLSGTEVTSGLAEGEAVISPLPPVLSEGMRVRAPGATLASVLWSGR